MAGVSVSVTLDKTEVIKRINTATAKGQFLMAQQALKDSNYYCKHDSGALIAAGIKDSKLEEGLLIWGIIYAKKQYWLKTAYKSKNQNARWMWAHYANSQHGKEWQAVLQRAIDKGV